MAPWWNRRQVLLPTLAVTAGLAFAGILTPSVASEAALSEQAPATPRLFGEGTVSTGDNEFGPAFTPDGNTLLFCRTAPGRTNFQAILVSRRVKGAWAEPEVASFSGEWKDLDPSISPDGKLLVFASNRPVAGTEARKDYDLWEAERAGSGWSAPRHLGPLVNSDGDETTTSIASDGTLYLATTRAGGKGGRDLYVSQRKEGVYQAPEPLAALNTEFDDSNQFIAPDQTFLVFASNRGAPGEKQPAPHSKFWISRRMEGGTFGASAPLSSAVNAGSSVLTPVLTPDGGTFVFASTRNFADKPLGRRLSMRELTEKFRNPGNGLADLYEVDAAAAGLVR